MDSFAYRMRARRDHSEAFNGTGAWVMESIRLDLGWQCRYTPNLREVATCQAGPFTIRSPTT